MKHEHFLRSLCEQARGNQKNSVTGLLKEGPQDHPLNPNNNRLNGYFNTQQPRQSPSNGGEQGRGSVAWNPPLQTVEQLRQEVEFEVQRLLKLLPSINDETTLETLSLRNPNNTGHVLSGLPE